MRMCTCMYVYVYMHVYGHVYVHVYVHICVYSQSSVPDVVSMGYLSQRILHVRSRQTPKLLSWYTFARACFVSVWFALCYVLCVLYVLFSHSVYMSVCGMVCVAAVLLRGGTDAGEVAVAIPNGIFWTTGAKFGLNICAIL